jgi:hypothetical protein
MKIERISIQSCCGKKALIFKIDQPLSKDTLAFLIKNGFKETEHFTKAGILYVDNIDFVITGPIGANKLQIKCKVGDCEQKINNLEKLLSTL